MPRPALKPRGPDKRFLYVTPQIDQQLNGQPRHPMLSTYHAEQVIGIYLAGHLINASLRPPPKGIDVQLERLVNVSEVWALCFRKPGNGWRILGRFLEPMVLIALCSHSRDELNGWPTYTKFANQTAAEWTKILPGEQPYGGRDVSDYIGYLVQDVHNP